MTPSRWRTPPRNSCRLSNHHSHRKKREVCASAAAERPAARATRPGPGSPRPSDDHVFQNGRPRLLLHWPQPLAQLAPPLSKEYFLHKNQGRANPIDRVQHPALLLHAARASAPPLDGRLAFLAPLYPPPWSSRHPQMRRQRRCRPARHPQPRSSSTVRQLEGKRRSGRRPRVHVLLRYMTTRASSRPVGPRPQQTSLTPLLLLRHAAPPRLAPPRAQLRRQHPPPLLVRARQSREDVDRLWPTPEEWDARSTSTAGSKEV